MNTDSEVKSTEITLAELGVKFENLEDTVKNLSKRVSSHSSSLTRMGNKVFNGYGSKLDAMKDQVEHNKVDNDKAHIRIEEAVNGITKFGGVALIMIFATLLTILGSVWIQNNERSPVDTVRMEARVDAFDDSSDTATP